MTQVIRTERLMLRPLAPGDEVALAEGLNDFAVARFLTPVPHPYSRPMARAWLEARAGVAPPAVDFAVELPGAGLIGCVTIDKELGYWIGRAYWNRGYATEAARAALEWRFATNGDESIPSSAHQNNAASLRVQQKLGFREIGLQPRYSATLRRNVPHVLTTLRRQRFAWRIAI